MGLLARSDDELNVLSAEMYNLLFSADASESSLTLVIKNYDPCVAF